LRETEHEKCVILHVFGDFLTMKFCETSRSKICSLYKIVLVSDSYRLSLAVDLFMIHCNPQSWLRTRAAE